MDEDGGLVEQEPQSKVVPSVRVRPALSVMGRPSVSLSSADTPTPILFNATHFYPPQLCHNILLLSNNGTLCSVFLLCCVLPCVALPQQRKTTDIVFNPDLDFLLFLEIHTLQGEKEKKLMVMLNIISWGVGVWNNFRWLWVDFTGYCCIIAGQHIYWWGTQEGLTPKPPQCTLQISSTKHFQAHFDVMANKTPGICCEAQNKEKPSANYILRVGVLWMERFDQHSLLYLSYLKKSNMYWHLKVFLQMHTTVPLYRWTILRQGHNPQ